MNPSDLTKMSAADLQKSLSDKSAELADAVLSLKAGELSNTSQLRNLRRDIARIRTIINQKRHAGDQPGGEEAK